MASILNFTKTWFRKKPLTALRFPTSGFDVVRNDVALEEERFEEFQKGLYYPVNIGNVFASRYQIVGKLGYGATSTVWLARDLERHGYSTLKVFVRDGIEKQEFETYKVLSSTNPSHPGYNHVRTALDMFTIPRIGGDHHCLVQKPMWDSFKDLLNRNPSHRFTKELLQTGLSQVFLALDYLHSECNLVHTDIKAENILIEIEDNTILENFVNTELASPSPRKLVNSTTVYASRRFGLPKSYGNVVLSDFGSIVKGDHRRTHDAQPNVYRSPEVMLSAEWNYPVDIWNVGAMIWDLFEDKHLFYGNDPDGTGYKTRAHLAEVVSMLGPPPLDFLKRGLRTKEFFDDRGNWIAEIPIPRNMSLEISEENLSGREKADFLKFVSCMLQWRPEDRRTAKQLFDHPWLQNHT